MTKSTAAGPGSGSTRRFSFVRGVFARRTAAVAGAAVLAGTAAVCAPGLAYSAPRAAASTVPASAVPVTDFRDCPPLPDGVDPARWRCEVHTAAPVLTIGKMTTRLAPITMTHAEGPLPDGGAGQVWGAMHSAPTAVPGVRDLAIQPEYGGRSDFYTGTFSLRFRLLGPLAAPGCTIGADAPVDFRLTRSGPSTWVSQDPPLIEFSAYDDTFTVPAPEHCGPRTQLLDHRLGLPAAEGNLMTYDASYTFQTYDRLSRIQAK
ncbi:hypothetical protein [Streptomyces sp. NPDC048106]|uniref:hypothetical protein n=1 Tax=Streptomyces sp. NPDC048106 TaxID=3155750 RepID=UPI00345702EB